MRTALLSALLALGLAIGDAEAQNRFGGDPRTTFDSNEARDAVQEGRHVPLREILSDVQRRYPGRSLGAELSRTRPAMYEITWLTNEGQRLRIRANAETGEIVSVSGG